MSTKISNNIKECTTKQLKKALRKAFNTKRPVFIWGSTGIGKSDVIRQLGDELNAPVYDIRLSLCNDVSDLKGIPVPNMENQTMKWYQPDELPTKEECSKYKKVILLLDEMNSAMPQIQAAAYQLVLDYRIGNYILPDNVVIVAAGNRDSDRGVTYQMPEPLKTRFTHLSLRVDWDEWLEWALGNNIHPDIISFLIKNTHRLNNFDPKSNVNSHAVPRTWHMASDILNDPEDTDKETLEILVGGAVGAGVAMEFMAHRDLSLNLPNPMDILIGKVIKFEEKVEISAIYSLAIALCYRLKEQFDNNTTKLPIMDLVDNMYGFIMDNLSDEMAILAFRTVFKMSNIDFKLSNLKRKDEFNKRYTELLTAYSNSEN